MSRRAVLAAGSHVPLLGDAGISGYAAHNVADGEFLVSCRYTRDEMVKLLLFALLQAAVAAPGGDMTSYVIGPSDVLAVTVFNQAQLSGKFSVESDGTVAFPLVGRVSVGGLTIRGAESEITKRLAAGYLNDPRVSVNVEQYPVSKCL